MHKRLVGWRPVLGFERRLRQDPAVAAKQPTAVGFEQRGPDVFADFSPVRVIGAFARGCESIGAAFAPQLNAVVTRTAYGPVGAPFPPAISITLPDRK